MGLAFREVENLRMKCAAHETIRVLGSGPYVRLNNP